MVILVAAGVAVAGLPGRAKAQPRLTVASIAQDPCQPQQALPIPVQLTGQFEPDSSVLRTAGRIYRAPGRAGPLTPAESACAASTEQADLDWLRTGLVPGSTTTQRSMATRALLDLKLAVRPDGGVIAGWQNARAGWEYVWPRDSSWVAVALTDTGHPAMGYQILRFLQRLQSGDGTWAARYLPDGSGPVRDGRPGELDAVGWVPWAVWSWAVTQPLTPGGVALRELELLWPMVTRAADAAIRSLTADGLPEPATDYWEDSVQVTLGTAAPLLAGLRAAADLAADVGSATATSDGQRWAAAAARLATAVTGTFGRSGYQRTPSPKSGADAAITFLGPPFAVPAPAVLRAARTAQPVLTLLNGGLKPGANWPGTPGVAWTAETAFFALFDAATGQHSQAATLLGWLAAHRTKLGSLPEQVNSAGQPASVAPLSWTDAVTLLALLWSAICSFALGMAGQVAYHLLAQAGAARAPWPITMIVSCLPVLVLAMGTTLAHMLRADAGPGHGTRGPAADRPPARSYEDQAGPSPDQTASAGTPAEPGPPARTAAVPRQDHHPGPKTKAPGQTETNQARLIASRLAAAGKPVSRRALRSRGIRGSNAALNALAREINAEVAGTGHAAPGLDGAAA